MLEFSTCKRPLPSKAHPIPYVGVRKGRCLGHYCGNLLDKCCSVMVCLNVLVIPLYFASPIFESMASIDFISLIALTNLFAACRSS